MRRGRAWVWLSVALWPTYLNLKYAYNNARIVGLSHGILWQRFYEAIGAVDKLVGVDDLLPHAFLGTAPALTLLGVEFTDPVVVPALLLSVPSALLSLGPGLLAVFVIALLFGRGFCSFGCPASLLFGFNLRLRELIELRIPRLRELRRALPSGLRFGVLIGGSAAAVLFGAWVWQLLLPYALVSSQAVQLIAGVPMGLSSGVLAFVLLADLLILPGEVCRALCPLGLLLGRCSRLALLRVAASAAPCPSGCDSCSDACDLWLDPRDTTPADCNLCGRCVVACPTARLSIGPRLPRLPRPRRRAVGAAALVLALLAPAAAPDDVQIFLVVYDLRRQRPFGGEAEISIRSGDEVVTRWRKQAEQESLFYIHTRVPDGGDLSLDLALLDAGGQRVELSAPFHLPGEGGRNPLLWMACGLAGLIAVMLVASKQTRPGRRRKSETRP